MGFKEYKFFLMYQFMCTINYLKYIYKFELRGWL